MAVIPFLLEPWFGLIRALARVFGYELAVIAGEHRIKLKLISPEDERIAWDQTHYLNANIFPKDEVAPVRVHPDGSTRRSDEYKQFMQSHLLSEFLGNSKREMWIILGLLSIASIQMATIGLLFYL